MISSILFETFINVLCDFVHQDRRYSLPLKNVQEFHANAITRYT
jgi:hypothetical protein